MRHNGKLPKAVVGEVLHNINNALSPIYFIAEEIGGLEGERLLRAAEKIKAYVNGMGEKESWNSNPFDEEKAA